LPCNFIQLFSPRRILLEQYDRKGSNFIQPSVTDSSDPKLNKQIDFRQHTNEPAIVKYTSFKTSQFDVIYIYIYILHLVNKANLVHNLFLVYLLLVYLSISTCFGRLCAHHPEKQQCLCDTWYLLFWYAGAYAPAYQTAIHTE